MVGQLGEDVGVLEGQLVGEGWGVALDGQVDGER